MATLNDFTQMSFHEKLLVLEAIGDDFSHAEGILESHEWHQEVVQESAGPAGRDATLIDWDGADSQLPDTDS